MSVLSAIRARSVGLSAAIRDLADGAGIAYASPAFAFPIAYLTVYGVGAVLYADRMGPRAGVFVLAIVVGFVSYLIGVALTWRPRQPSATAQRAGQDRRIAIVGSVLVAVGVVAVTLYLLEIGGIPLFMEDVEQARVAAADRGGAPLRVTALLALPGAWLLVGQAAAARSLRWIAVAAGSVILVAGLQILTANRAPAFLTVEVALVAYLLGAGIERIRARGLTLLIGAALALVIAAGVIGGYRLGATPTTWRDPQIARAVASGDGVALTTKAISNYLVVPIQNFSSVLDAVPAFIDWRLGYTYLQPVLTVMPGRQTTFDQDLKEALAQDYAGGGTVPSLLGEAYANFGPVGWVIVPAAVGMLLTVLYRFARERRTIAAWTLYAWIVVHMANATIGGIIVASVFPYIAAVVLGGIALGTGRRSSAPS